MCGTRTQEPRHRDRRAEDREDRGILDSLKDDHFNRL